MRACVRVCSRAGAHVCLGCFTFRVDSFMTAAQCMSCFYSNVCVCACCVCEREREREVYVSYRYTYFFRVLVAFSKHCILRLSHH